MKTKVAGHLFVVLVILLISGCIVKSPDTSGVSESEIRSPGEKKDIEFKTVYPGVYGQYERELIDRFQEILSGGHEEWREKINARRAGKELLGGMRVQGLPVMEDYTPTSDELLSAASKLNPLNPLYTDPEYAKKTRYGGLIAAPFAVQPSVGFPQPPEGTDIFVSSDDPAIGRGLDHELTFYKPIYPGDTLNGVLTEQSCTDISDPDGSKVRKLRMVGDGDVYNDKGEKVMRGRYSGVETFKHFKDRSMAAEYDKPLFIYWPRYYDWDKIRPRHVYTEAEWDYIKELWSKEYIRGADTLYWEDVNIGDEPTWTCEGPAVDGGRTTEGLTVRNILMNLAPNEIQTRLYKDSFGIYRIKADETGTPRGPGQGEMLPGGAMPASGSPGSEASTHPNARSSFQNTIGRGYATRLVTNWMGDDGWLYKLAWKLAFCLDEGRNVFPAEHDRPSYLLKVPYLKEQGKFMNTHGYDGDMSITKGYVCDKYVKDGAHYVDLVVWCETIEGDIWCECYAVVELPSREDRI